ncbi:MAG: tail fiber domain-containing protein [Alphaproteobacteria bacterium]|nr:tail fiber domain-containing protein [Alphaproteobacteria bacterium]
MEAQTAEAERALAERERLGPIQEELLNLALEDLRRGGAATPEQISLIAQAGDAALERGGTDIERFRTDSLEALREELAPSPGLRPSDTPILDRGARVAAEATRQGAQLAAGIRGAEATARLNFPLAQSQLLQQSSLGLSRLTEATRQFQDQLRSSAIASRIGLFQSVGGQGLGLANTARTNIAGSLSSLRDVRLGSGTQTTSGFGQTVLGLGSVLSGVGAAGSLFGAGQVFGPALVASSRDFKEDIVPIDEDAVLEKVARLPVSRCKYRETLGLADGIEHVGPMAQDLKETFGLGSDEAIPIVDAIGIGLAATKGLAKKVERIEHSLGLADASKRLERGGTGLGLREAHGRVLAKAGGLGLAKAA